MPQGQGHRTVLAQVVADVLGLKPIRHPRHRPNSIPQRTPGRSRRAITRAASPPRWRAPPISPPSAARQARADRRGAAERCGPRISSSPAGASPRARTRTTRIPFSRLAAASHWSPGLVPEESAQAHARDRVLDAAGTHARRTRKTRSTPHSATASFSISAASRSTAVTGACASTATSPCTTAAAFCIRAWSPARSRGGFAQALGAALYEEFAYGADGSLPVRDFRRLPAADDHGSAGRR